MPEQYPPIRRFVTGHDADHAAKVIMQGPATNAKHPSPGTVSMLIWSTDRTPADIAVGEQIGFGRAHHRHRAAGERDAVRRHRLPAGQSAAHAPHRDHRLRHRARGRDRDGPGRFLTGAANAR